MKPVAHKRPMDNRVRCGNRCSGGPEAEVVERACCFAPVLHRPLGGQPPGAIPGARSLGLILRAHGARLGIAPGRLGLLEAMLRVRGACLAVDWIGGVGALRLRRVLWDSD